MTMYMFLMKSDEKCRELHLISVRTKSEKMGGNPEVLHFLGGSAWISNNTGKCKAYRHEQN